MIERDEKNLRFRVIRDGNIVESRELDNEDVTT